MRLANGLCTLSDLWIFDPPGWAASKMRRGGRSHSIISRRILDPPSTGETPPEVVGIEPTSMTLEITILPLNYTSNRYRPAEIGDDGPFRLPPV